MKLRDWSVLTLLVMASCPNDKDDTSEFPPTVVMDIPTAFQGREAAIAMRLTNANPTDPLVKAAFNAIANQQLDPAEMLMRGGVPKDADGNEIDLGSTTTSQGNAAHQEMLAGTAVEQLKAFYERIDIDNQGPFPAADTVDSCGNPMLAAFVTPNVLQHVTDAPTSDPVWPDACVDMGTNCNTFQTGTMDIAFTEPRVDGFLDMLVTIFPNVLESPARPALSGHLLGYFLSSNNPGFLQAPMVANTRQFQVAILNMWQQQKLYADAQGLRTVFAFPHASREVTFNEVIVSMEPLGEAACLEYWDSNFDGQIPFGCSSQHPLLLDRNSVSGQEVYDGYMKEGTDTFNLDQIINTFRYTVSTAVTCPTVEDAAYVVEGPVEMFLCPDGNLDTCIAAHDMEEYGCRPVEGTELVLNPVNQSIPLRIGEYNAPYIIAGAEPPEWTIFMPTAPEPPPPFVGSYIDIELEVQPGTVLYLDEPERLGEISDPNGDLVELSEPLSNSHCTEDLSTRYDIGEEWAPGLYTIRVPWTDGAPSLSVYLTSVGKHL